MLMEAWGHHTPKNILELQKGWSKVSFAAGEMATVFYVTFLYFSSTSGWSNG